MRIKAEMFEFDAPLGMGNVGYGPLTESCFVRICSDAFLTYLMAPGGTPADLISLETQSALDVGFYAVSFRNPPQTPLSRFQLWDAIKIGVQASTFKNMLVDLECVLLGPAGGGAAEENVTAPAPSMAAGVMFWSRDEGTADAASIASPDVVRSLPTLRRPPASQGKFRQLQMAQSLDADFPSTDEATLAYDAIAPRDFYVKGERTDMPCWKYFDILDVVEREYCTSSVQPRWPQWLVDACATTERDSYFFGMPEEADHLGLREISLQVRVRSSMQLPDEGQALAGAEVLGQWVTLSEIRGRNSAKLLAACRTRKLVAVETARQKRLAEAREFFKAVRVEESV